LPVAAQLATSESNVGSGMANARPEPPATTIPISSPEKLNDGNRPQTGPSCLWHRGLGFRRDAYLFTHGWANLTRDSPDSEIEVAEVGFEPTTFGL
jgi:hypothetical protein